MIKKVYRIEGFDCANCARKTEEHLNRDKRISYARLDFAGNRLYLTFRDNEVSETEILRVIKEVEENKITLYSIDAKIEKKKFFDKKTICLIGRIILSIILLIIAATALNLHDINNPIYWVQCGFYIAAILIIGYDVFWRVIKKIIKLKNPIDEYFLITLAVIGIIILTFIHPEPDNFFGSELFEGVMVILLYQIGKVIESYATNKGKNAISTALDLRSEKTTLLAGDETKVIDLGDIKVGDVLIVSTGGLIPADGEIIDGQGMVDTSSLTGEYIPVSIKKGSEVLAGYILKEGSVKVKALKGYKDSSVAKVLELVTSSGEHKSKAESFIAKFAKYYTPAVALTGLIFLIIFGCVTQNWVSAVIRALEIIVVACPCAIVISIPLTYFSAIGLASKNGIVVKGANYLDKICNLKKLVTDKTGTLTHGSFVITKVKTNIKEEEFEKYLLAAECLSSHPIGKAICHGKNVKNIKAKLKDFTEHAGEGVIVNFNGDIIRSGSAKFLGKSGIFVEKCDEIGTIIYLAKNDEYLGYVVLSDEIKEDAEPMISYLHHEGVEVVLLTGDKEDVAKATCERLTIDKWHSELMPEDKLHYLEEEMSNTKGTVAFIGDGINDAPSIIRSDVGIAMGGMGSDMAVENSDVVIMNDNPVKVYEVLKVAKMAKKRAIAIIVFSLLVKISVMVISGLGLLEGKMIIAVLADTGLTVLMILFAIVLLYQKIHFPKLENDK